MKNKKIEKLLVKATIAGVFSALIGFVYKAGERTGERLDEKYEKQHGVPKKLWG